MYIGKTGMPSINALYILYTKIKENLKLKQP